MSDDSVLMAKLSVNVNKVATLRNSRGGHLPSVIEAVRVCVDAGAPGITVHPRADERHITPADVRDIADELAPLRGGVEFNIEGDPRPDLVDLVLAVQPDQCTLVPVLPGEITSQAGWPADTPPDGAGRRRRADEGGGRPRQPVRRSGAGRRSAGPRDVGADRVELYTEPFARAFERGPDGGRGQLRAVRAGGPARARAGARRQRRPRSRPEEPHAVSHALPHLDEVSIGHALIGRALFVGLRRAVRDYLAARRRTPRVTATLVAARRALVAALLACSAAVPAPPAVPSPCRPPTASPSPASSTRPRRGPRRRRAGAHASPHSRRTGTRCAQRLEDAGITALAIDLRGHGGSGGSAAPLAGHGAGRARGGAVAVGASHASARMPSGWPGASLGANLACWRPLTSPCVRAVALLSPSLDYRGLRVGPRR